MIEWKDFIDLTSLHAEYAAAVDGGDWDSWPEFFTDECVYKIQPRENYERGFPLATLSFESKGMIRDRVDRKSKLLNSSHRTESRMPSSA